MGGKPTNECFTIVPEHISTHDGKQRFGWCIHVWQAVLIEAEFQCIWESPEKDLIDITPKDYTIDNIIFLPDPQKVYRGRQVDNIRKSISADKRAAEFIKLAKEYYNYINRGDLADYCGDVEIKEDFIEQYDHMRELERGLLRRHGNKRGISVAGKFIKYDRLPR